MTPAEEAKWSASCEARQDATLDYRRKKAGKNILKHFFYFGHFRMEERYPDSWYDKISHYVLLRKLRNYEKKGVNVRRSYPDIKEFLPESHFELYKDPITRYSIFRPRMKNCCPWDYSDLLDFIIIKLTVMGLYISLSGHSIDHKQVAHEIWTCREKFYKLLALEDSFMDPDDFGREEQLRAEAFQYLGDNILKWWD